MELSQYPNRNDKIKYRLWKEQDHMCIYSGKTIQESELFSNEVEIDHIVPRSLCLDDSYLNKVVCLTSENRIKGQRTPIEAWDSDNDKWNDITNRIERFYKDRPHKKYRKNKTHPKKDQFYMRQKDIADKYGMSSTQLNDTRYIAKLALGYIEQLGCDVLTSKGVTTAWLRKQWGLNNLLPGNMGKKDRTDHRHHTIDAAVIACIDRQFYKKVIKSIADSEKTNKKINLKSPYPNFRAELEERLKHFVVSHTPQRKLSGGLHQETGYGYIKNKWLVTRCALDSEFTRANAESIIDDAVRQIVLQHMELYENDSKKAFTTEELKKLKVSKNPIKRVRILKPKTTFNNAVHLEKLSQSKFGVTNEVGDIFKWHDFGNMHHVEIIRHKETGKYKGEFVTMMEAHRRAMTGTKSAQHRNVEREQIIKQNHGDEWQFVMALHINDLVSFDNEDGVRVFYRVQVLDRDGGRLELRLHSAATLKNKNEHIRKSITALMKDGLAKHQINAIGIISND